MIAVPFTPPPRPTQHPLSVGASLFNWVPTNSLTLAVPRQQTKNPSGVLPNAQIFFDDLLSKDTLFGQFAQRILELRIKDADEPSEDYPASAYSVAQAFYLTPLSRLTLGQRWRVPRVVTDGFGGIRLNWSNRGRDVRLWIPSAASTQKQLYWEEGDNFGSEVDVTPTTLIKYLWWASDDARNIAG